MSLNDDFENPWIANYGYKCCTWLWLVRCNKWPLLLTMPVNHGWLWTGNQFAELPVNHGTVLWRRTVLWWRMRVDNDQGFLIAGRTSPKIPKNPSFTLVKSWNDITHFFYITWPLQIVTKSHVTWTAKCKREKNPLRRIWQWQNR